MNVNPPILFPVIIRFSKVGLMRFISHLDLQALEEVLFLKAGLAIAVSEGPTHRIKIKTSPPTPVGVASQTELTYLNLREFIAPEELSRRIKAQCPEGIEVVYVRDAAFLARKNPFGSIEAAFYKIEIPGEISDSNIENIRTTLDAPNSEGLSSEPDEDELSQFKGKIIETNVRDNSIELLVNQREGDTFHAAKCAEFLMTRLDLPHFPIFTKLDYYRLTPSRRKLFA